MTIYVTAASMAMIMTIQYTLLCLLVWIAANDLPSHCFILFSSYLRKFEDEIQYLNANCQLVMQ